MSFICEKCKVPQGARVKPHRVVLLEREVEYHTQKRDLEGDLVPMTVMGREIAKEANLCRPCAKEMSA